MVYAVVVLIVFLTSVCQVHNNYKVCVFSLRITRATGECCYPKGKCSMDTFGTRGEFIVSLCEVISCPFTSMQVCPSLPACAMNNQMKARHVGDGNHRRHRWH